MKFNTKLLLLLMVLFIGSYSVKSILFIYEIYNDESQLKKVNELVGENLGRLNEFVTDIERQKVFRLYFQQRILQERRIDENRLYPGPIETLWLKLINNKLESYTRHYLYSKESQTDKIGYDPFHNYEIKTLRKLKDYLSDADYQRVIYLYSANKIHDKSAKTDLLNVFENYAMMNKEVIVKYLTEYEARTHNVTYTVDNQLNLARKNTILSNVDVEVETLHKEIFNVVTELLPSEFLRHLTGVVFLVDREDAKVIEPALDEVTLIIDPIDYEMLSHKRPFYESILHQYFHYVTLNEMKVRSGSYCDMSVYCDKNYIANKESYVNQFYQHFWKSIFDDRIVNELTNEFYRRHQYKFVSPYAASNPIEDLAETFAYFVLDEDVSDNSTVIKDKLNFFNQFEEWVNFRSEFRQKIEVLD